MRLPFVKYHGLGNDFVVVDRRAQGPSANLPAEVVIQLCDRHRGVGADGVLSLWSEPGTAGRMQVQNADGSESGMCGNGLRCVARFLAESGLGESTVTLAAAEGRYRIERLAIDRYRVDMGRAKLLHADLPAADSAGEVELTVNGERLRGTVVHLGNPHWVTFVDTEPRAAASRLGAAIERHSSFPRRVNASFVRAERAELVAVVFERGVGITEACGSGACAVGVAAVKRGLRRAGEPIGVRLPGGLLTITVDPDLGVTMEGEAVRVFAGEIRHREPARVNPYRVLIVDDDAFFLKVYGDFLRSRGFEVDLATGGVQALQLYGVGRYQLVVVDLVMPDLSGIELIERIRKQNPAQDIIVVTGTEDVRTAVRAMRLGVYDYLVKPIEREELVLVIDRLQERATLYDEHARLLSENIQRAETQQLFHRGLRILQTLDLETVCESLLETLSDICGAQGAALWLAREDGAELVMHGYRGLIEPAALPMALSFPATPVSGELARGWPVLAKPNLPEIARMNEPAEALLCPLSREGRLVGLVLLVDKLGGGFSSQDGERARLICECGVTAVAHARRFRHLERVGLRDPNTTAYNMTYFVDYLGRELHKARRYRRSFSLVQIAVDNLPSLRQALAPEVYRETLRRITLAISSVLRDIDVLARVTDDEMYLLSPETDFLGGLSFARAARDAMQKSPFLAEIDRKNPIHVSFGPAAFPRDGDDVDQLFSACKRRLAEARRSLFRRLHLEDVDFWGAVDLLIGDAAPYEGPVLQPSRSFSMTEDEKGISRHHVFPAGFELLARHELVAEAARQGRSSGWLFLGGELVRDEALPGLLAKLEPTALKTYALAGAHPASFAEAGHVTSVRVEGDAFKRHELLLLLAEHAAYGMLTRRRADGRLFGFHTADWTLVEGLIGKLQETYHLQRGAS